MFNCLHVHVDTTYRQAVTCKFKTHFDSLHPATHAITEFSLGLTLLTWNVNGLLDKIKRGVVLKHTCRSNPDIALLQETHLLGHNTPFLARMGLHIILASLGVHEE